MPGGDISKGRKVLAGDGKAGKDFGLEDVLPLAADGTVWRQGQLRGQLFDQAVENCKLDLEGQNTPLQRAGARRGGGFGDSSAAEFEEEFRQLAAAAREAATGEFNQPFRAFRSFRVVL